MKFLVVASAFFLAACGRDESIYSYGGYGGEWVLQTLNGASYDADARLAFGANGRVTGTAPCNGFSMRQSVPYPWIKFGPIAVTRKACPELQAEQEFLAVLQRITLGIIKDDVLTLSNDDGDKMILVRMPPRDG